MFIIFLFSIILIVWFYTKTLNFRLNLYLINNNVNVGIATLKDKDLVVVNNKKYPLLSVFKYFVAIKVLKYIDQKHISLDTKITINQNMLDMQTHSPHQPERGVQLRTTVCLQGLAKKDKQNARDSYKGSVANIMYDINGFGNKPDRAGKDMFYFIVDDNGTVIPYGSKQYINAYNEGIHHLWKYSNNRCNETGVASGYACTGSIADNGWKVIYE